MKTYCAARGNYGKVEAWIVDDEGRRPLRHLRVHSPTGFHLGEATDSSEESGSGAADLALAILADYFGMAQPTAHDFESPISGYAERPWKHHQAFAESFIESAADALEITEGDIQDWLKEQPDD